MKRCEAVLQYGGRKGRPCGSKAMFYSPRFLRNTCGAHRERDSHLGAGMSWWEVPESVTA